MTQDPRFQTLLETAQQAYCGTPAMTAFTPFPGDVTAQPVTPYHCTCSDVFQADTALTSSAYRDLQDAIRAASPIVHWRETYRGTDIGRDFMDRFACYCIIGENAPFTSEAIRLFMVYMPAGLYYPWHHHPAKEIYMVISGNAAFRRQGHPDTQLFEGDTSFHESNQPHAMETGTDPVLCLVAWRADFDTPPVLTR